MSSSILLSPLTIRKTTLRNRIMLPSMVTHYCAVNGEVSERLIAYHAERAHGGVGLNILESTSVDDTGKSYWPGVSIASDHFIKGLRRLTDAIHAHGGKAGIQLNHAGRLAQPAVSGHPRQLVSYIPGLTTYDEIHVMDEDDIERVIGSFCSAAERAAEAGFDVVEIHGAHGYLLSQFMSPLFNRREDAYGGSFEKRMRVSVEVIRGIRKRLGPDFPLFFRCSVEEYLPGGITLELARDIARTVADNGIDLFNVSVGLGETNRFTGPPPCLPKGWNADRAAAIKEALGDRALVGVAGRIIDLLAVFALLAGTATTFSVATPLMAAILGDLLHFTVSQTAVNIVILLLTCAVYTYSLLHGFKGIGILAKVCIYLFFGLLAFVLLFGGETRYIIETGFTSLGRMVQNFIGLSTFTDPLRTSNFPQNWTIYYWAYWMVWCVAAPFFIGSISRGRTVRQTILGGYAFGVGSTIISFIILGNYSMGMQVTGRADFIRQYAETGDLYGMIVGIIKTLPGAPVIMVAVLVTMIAFYATSFDSIALTASCYSYHTLKDGELPHKAIQLMWCILLILLPIALLFAESSMSNLQSVSIVAAGPIAIVILLIAASFLKDGKSYLRELASPAESEK